MTARRDLGRWLHAHLVYPAVVHGRGEGGVFAELEQLRRVERLSGAALLKRARTRLRDMLQYAHVHASFYGSHWASVLRGSGPDLNVFAELPRVTKLNLQRDVQRMRAQPAPARVTGKTTGGSTGEAVTVFKDRNAIAREMAASWLGYGWFGIHIGDRAVRFWGRPHSRRRRLRFAAADFAMHRIRFSAFAFTENDLERYWQRCVSFQPDYFYGYVSMLEEFARFVEKRGYDGAVLKLKAIITTSEVLASAQRRLIERVFSTAVQNEYGCGEVGPIAYQCEQDRLHVMSENIFLELLNPNGEPAAPGETGEIVVTDLNNRAMPLVRYAMGDFGVWGEPCPCGRGFPVLERIWGRAYDFIEAPDGRRYHGEFLMYFFEDLRSHGLEVQQFQVIQERRDRLNVRVVSPGAAWHDLERQIRGGLAERISGVEVQVQRVDAIERAPSGKIHLIQNRSGAPSGAVAQ
jgi:phenylacetate-CoA ligase